MATFVSDLTGPSVGIDPKRFVACNVGQVIQITVRDRAGAENRLAALEEVDDLVVAHLLSHVSPLPVSGLALASPSTLRSPYCRPLAGVIHTLSLSAAIGCTTPQEEANPLRAR